MIDAFEDQELRSSGELWSQICSGLPEAANDAAPDNHHFTDSFHPPQANDTNSNPTSAAWEPMEDSEVYIASLENRLRKIKGQSSDVTSKDMLRSLSQAKKECWDRFLHDPQTSELFQGGDMDESTLEYFKRWLIPEKVAISAEELEYLLRPSQTQEAAGPDQTQNGEDTEEEKDSLDKDSPEK